MNSTPRHRTPRVDVGGVGVGGSEPIRIQSMTNTDTADIEATVQQVIDLYLAGSEMVRVTVNGEKQAHAVEPIVSTLRERGCPVPVIGDFHYNGHILLRKVPACAKALDKYRINPGNVGTGDRHDKNFRSMIEVAIEYQKPVRIGVNGGSLDQQLLQRLIDEDLARPVPRGARTIFKEAMVASALESAEKAMEYGMRENQIILSTKLSDVQEVVEVYRALAQRSNFCLHVGLTEAGIGSKGIVASTLALGLLLSDGIGDTIRVSLTPRPNEPRTHEVQICQHILQTLGMRSFNPLVTACPGCGRTTSTLFQEIAVQVEDYLRRRMPEWKAAGYKGVEEMKVAVMGCVVNGPGEARGAHIGLSLPGTGEEPAAPVYADGQHIATLRGKDLPGQFRAYLDRYVDEHYSPLAQAAR